MLFSKLTEAQQKDFYDHNSEKFDVYDDWDEFMIESIKEALELIGFDNVKIGFSGFWSQGDGANFTGSYRYQKGALARAKKEFPQWEELHILTEELQALQAREFYSIRFKISHRGRYSHENCTSFDFADDRHRHGWTGYGFKAHPWEYACKQFMRHIYDSLEQEYDYLRSWEYVKENPEAWDFIDIGLAA